MHIHFAAILAVMFAAAPAFAQAPPITRIRGTIETLDGATLTVHPRSGPNVAITLVPGATVTSASITQLADIHLGSFIGTTAVPEPGGGLRALEVHIFPESMRGTGEGHRPWDRGPESTMTNGAVGQIAGSDGRSFTVKYQDGEKTVTVPPDVPIIAYDIGAMTQLTPGAHVIIMANKAADGTLSTNRVTVGKDGIELPI